jgi:hypothetical protein
VRITEARHKALTAKIQYEARTPLLVCHVIAVLMPVVPIAQALKKEQDLVRTFEATRRCVGPAAALVIVLETCMPRLLALALLRSQRAC